MPGAARHETRRPSRDIEPVRADGAGSAPPPVPSGYADPRRRLGHRRHPLRLHRRRPRRYAAASRGRRARRPLRHRRRGPRRIGARSPTRSGCGSPTARPPSKDSAATASGSSSVRRARPTPTPTPGSTATSRTTSPPGSSSPTRSPHWTRWPPTTARPCCPIRAATTRTASSASSAYGTTSRPSCAPPSSGVSKPDAAAFHAACDALELDPAEVGLRGERTGHRRAAEPPPPDWPESGWTGGGSAAVPSS